MIQRSSDDMHKIHDGRSVNRSRWYRHVTASRSFIRKIVRRIEALGLAALGRLGRHPDYVLSRRIELRREALRGDIAQWRRWYQANRKRQRQMAAMKRLGGFKINPNSTGLPRWAVR